MTRMWMVEPEIMCRKHLLGEHLELHMLIGCIKQMKSLDGYADKGLIWPMLIMVRHDELVKEMINRGYDHNSPIDRSDFMGMIKTQLLKYPDKVINATVNYQQSKIELLERCPGCKKRSTAQNASRQKL